MSDTSTPERAALPQATGRWQRLLMPLVSLGLFVAALWGIHHLLAEITAADLAAELRRLSFQQVLLAFLFTTVSFVALTGYDWAALRYIDKRLPYRTVALTSFCGYAISNTVGLSLLSGGSVRYRFYLASGLDGSDIARLSLFSIVGLGVGIHLVGAAALLIHPEMVSSFFGIRAGLLEVIGISALTMIGALVAVTFYRKEPIRLGPWRMRLPSGPTTLLQLLFAYKHVEYAHVLWWQFEYDAEALRGLRSVLGVTITLVGLSLYRLLQTPPAKPGLPGPADLVKAEAIVREQDQTTGNLALMGDKRFLFSERGDAFVMFGISGQSWVALGDPVGPMAAREELAWDFRERADREGRRVAFYPSRYTAALPRYGFDAPEARGGSRGVARHLYAARYPP